MIGRRSAAALLALALTSPLAAEPRIEVTVEPRNVTLGDRIAATVVLRLDAGDERAPTLPDWSRGWGKLAVLSAPAAERTETPAGVEWRQRLELAAFEVGRLELPSLEIELTPSGAESEARVVTPSNLEIEVRSVLPTGGEEVQPMPAEPPRRLSLSPAFWWTAAALVAVSAALGLLLAWRRRTAGSNTTSGKLTPLAELERAFAALSDSDPSAALAALSLALRRYLGRTLSLPAAESTTSELSQRLGARGLERPTVQRASRLLREVDQVKFARRAADRAETQTRIAEARAVAQEVERHLNPPSGALDSEPNRPPAKDAA